MRNKPTVKNAQHTGFQSAADVDRKNREAVFVQIIDHLWDMPKDMSLIDLAYKAKVHPMTLQFWKHGPTVCPRLTTLVRVGAALGYTLVWKKATPVLTKRGK